MKDLAHIYLLLRLLLLLFLLKFGGVSDCVCSLQCHVSVTHCSLLLFSPVTIPSHTQVFLFGLVLCPTVGFLLGVLVLENCFLLFKQFHRLACWYYRHTLLYLDKY